MKGASTSFLLFSSSFILNVKLKQFTFIDQQPLHWPMSVEGICSDYWRSDPVKAFFNSHRIHLRIWPVRVVYVQCVSVSGKYPILVI